MAKIIEEDEQLILKLNLLEKIGACHGNLVVDKSKLINKNFKIPANLGLNFVSFTAAFIPEFDL